MTETEDLTSPEQSEKDAKSLYSMELFDVLVTCNGGFRVCCVGNGWIYYLGQPLDGGVFVPHNDEFCPGYKDNLLGDSDCEDAGLFMDMYEKMKLHYEWMSPCKTMSIVRVPNGLIYFLADAGPRTSVFAPF